MDNDSDGPIVQGLALRSVLVLALLEHGRPMQVPELAMAVRGAGFITAGRASKEISDALRWEVRLGRVVRVQRGVYRAGHVAGVTRHRMRARVNAIRSGAGAVAADTRVAA